MCEGWRAIDRAPALVEAIDVIGAGADDVLGAARPMVTTNAEAYCVAAAAVGAVLGDQPSARRRRLGDLQAGFRRKTQQVMAVNR
jgi:hypothetical protein